MCYSFEIYFILRCLFLFEFFFSSLQYFPPQKALAHANQITNGMALPVEILWSEEVGRADGAFVSLVARVNCLHV